MKAFASRLLPGQDLKQRLNAITAEHSIKAGCVLACVGSLTQARLRLAGGDKIIVLHGKFEIVSLTGTLSPDGCHLHMSVADEDGQTIGGHLMDENLIYTTAEVVIGQLPGYQFSRAEDEKTGYKELVICEAGN